MLIILINIQFTVYLIKVGGLCIFTFVELGSCHYYFPLVFMRDFRPRYHQESTEVGHPSCLWVITRSETVDL